MMWTIKTGETIEIPVKVIGRKMGMTPIEFKIEIDGHQFWITGKKLIEMGATVREGHE